LSTHSKSLSRVVLTCLRSHSFDFIRNKSLQTHFVADITIFNFQTPTNPKHYPTLAAFNLYICCFWGISIEYTKSNFKKHLRKCTG
jgi:hypothetical protein